MANTQQPGVARRTAGERWRGFLKSTRNIRIWMERLLLISGLVLVAIYGAARIESNLRSKAILEQFEAAVAAEPAEPVSKGIEPTESESRLEVPEPDFSGWSKQRIAEYAGTGLGQSKQAVGVLEIPRIRLKAPVLEGTDDLTLNHAIGRIAGTAQPGEDGNIGLAGHRDGFFRGLKNLNVGDRIELQTRTGRSAYLVEQIQIVKPTDVSVLQKRAKPSLTLVTCYPFYFIGSAPERYIVTASLEQRSSQEPHARSAAFATEAKTKGE